MLVFFNLFFEAQPFSTILTAHGCNDSCISTVAQSQVNKAMTSSALLMNVTIWFRTAPFVPPAEPLGFVEPRLKNTPLCRTQYGHIGQLSWQ